MRISSLLRGDLPTVSFEFFPPKSDAGRDSLLRVIDRLAEVRPDFVSVTYGAGGSTRALSLDICRAVKEHTEATVMAHLTGMCHTEQEIETIADQLWDLGVVNTMTLRGDRPRDAALDMPTGDFPFAANLMRFLQTRHPFCMGGACYPEGHKETPSISVGIEHLKQKIDAGCEFLVTQLFFNNEAYFRFVEQLRNAGVEVPVVPGIMPVTGFSQLEKFETQFGASLPSELREAVLRHEGDESAISEVGIEWSAKQCSELLAGGAPGIHFYTLNKSSATVKVCLAMGLAGQQVSAD